MIRITLWLLVKTDKTLLNNEGSHAIHLISLVFFTILADLVSPKKWRKGVAGHRWAVVVY